MHKIIIGVEVVFIRWSPQISLLIDINPEVVSKDSPDTNIEFASSIKQGFLDVLLDNPELVFLSFLKNVFSDIPQIMKDSDASTLVQRCWLDHPHIFLTVAPRHSLISRSTVLELAKAVHKHLDFSIIMGSCNYISSWVRIKHAVACLPCCIVCFVICF